MRVFQMIGAMAAASALVILGLWSWQAAADLVAQWQVSRPDVAVWSIRCGAIAIAALAQVLVLRVGIRAIYRRRQVFDDLLGITSAVACVIAAVSAVALGFAGK